jgi:superfamily II DNA or RNA helicase
VVKNWKRIAPGQKTVVFTVTVANAQALCDEFKAAGVPAEWISGATPEDEQEKIFERHNSGETLVLCNAQLLSFGWDSPAVTCCVLAKPTKSIANYLQMAGRVLRPSDGKTHATLIDHSGVVDKLGFVDDDFGWTLDGKQVAAENKSRKKDDHKPHICPVCKSLHKPAPKCPCCGAEFGGHKPKSQEQIQAELEEVTREKRKANREMTPEQKARFYGELRLLMKQRGYRDGWADNQFRERFGVWTNAYKLAPEAHPSNETLSWVKSRLIRYAKSQARNA